MGGKAAAVARAAVKHSSFPNPQQLIFFLTEKTLTGWRANLLASVIILQTPFKIPACF